MLKIQGDIKPSIVHQIITKNKQNIACSNF